MERAMATDRLCSLLIASSLLSGAAMGADSTAGKEKYNGEDIQRDIAPGWHTMKKGETLTSVARDHLGPDASADDIKKYSAEIARRNGLDPKHLTNLDGKELALEDLRKVLRNLAPVQVAFEPCPDRLVLS